jgi:predicted GH43/DUF377 family glycosyl hydrolase
MVGWAQSPQPVVLDDVVRVYFSTRSLEADGMYVSHMVYVDLSKDMREVLRVASAPVLAPGGLGTFDEHGIFPMQVVQHGDQLLGYTCGWSRRVSVSVETGIGLAISIDGGESFERIGPGPILAASPLEPFLVGDAHVRVIGETFHMWYIFGTEWAVYPGNDVPDRTYKIGHAVSADGINWSKDEGVAIIADVLGPRESQALPSVIEIDGIHHMFFCYRHSDDFRTGAGRGYRIGHAWSTDLRSWRRDDAMLGLQGTAGEWDSDMQCYPNVIEVDGSIYLLYNGNRFGRDGFGVAVLER